MPRDERGNKGTRKLKKKNVFHFHSHVEKTVFFEGGVLHLWGVAAWLAGGSLKDFQGPAPEHRLMAVRRIWRGCKVLNQDQQSASRGPLKCLNS